MSEQDRIMYPTYDNTGPIQWSLEKFRVRRARLCEIIMLRSQIYDLQKRLTKVLEEDTNESNN